MRNEGAERAAKRPVSSRYSAKGLAELKCGFQPDEPGSKFLVAIARRVLRNGGSGHEGDIDPDDVSSRYSAKGLAERCYPTGAG